ncbi:MAG: outer membrane protein assembly factor BamB [Planctomycetota bacterium]|jgi:outer membrane protein assembly factor BamB
MTKGNSSWALLVIVLALGACATDPSMMNDDTEHGTSMSMTDQPVDPMIQRQRDLEAAALGIADEVIWSFKTGEGEQFTRTWARGRWLLAESYNAQSGEYSIHCIDINKGRGKWVLVVGEHPLSRAPRIGHGTVAFLTQKDGGMVVVNATTGGRMFHKRTRVGVVPASDAVSMGDTVYVSNYVSTRMAALAASDGIKGWDFRTDGTCRSAPVLTRGLAQQLLVFGTDNGKLYGLPAKGYNEVAPTTAGWTTDLNGAVSADLTFTMVGEADAMRGLVIVPCEDGWLYGIEPATGRSRWVLRTDKAFTENVQVMNGHVFARNADRFFCLDGVTGSRSWWSPSAEGLSEFEKTQLFRAPEGYEHADRALAANGDRVYLLDGDNKVIRCDAKTGEIKSDRELGDFDFFISNEATENLVVATKDGYFIALK